ncbi:IBR domain-containing protein [Apiospora rasikravindrae]|uniref:RBR-type E3 ubiquitin transferase n=1 Tax=Apiospora rasikravindrae TaxID=990691 RepID=A0ABR1UC87_9PEZI
MSSVSLHLAGDLAVIATTLLAYKVFDMLLVPSKQDGQDAPAIEITKAPQGERPKWKGKGKEIIRRPVPTITTVIDDDTEEAGDPVDWTQYEPPEGLTDTHHLEFDIIETLLKESIDKVKARIVEEAVRKAEAEAFKLEENERKEEDVETGQTDSLAIEVTQQEPSTDGSQTDITTPASEASPRPSGSASVNFAETRLTIDQHGLLRPAPIPPKSIKRSLLGFLRRLNTSDKAGSSNASSSRTRGMSSASSLDLDTRLNALLAGSRRSQSVREESTLGNSTDTESSIHKEQFECVSCLDDFDLDVMVAAPCHNYCQDCFTRLITSACEHEQHWPPKCCLNTIPEPTILTLTDEDLKQRYRSRAEEWDIPVSERVYCHQPECSAWLRPGQIDRALNVARCAAGHSTCTLCRAAQHGRGTCPQDRDVLRTTQLAEEAGWKRCIGCHAYVEHSDACQHMTCRCGAEFCYVCGARWRTCACTMGQLAAVKTAARARQEARVLRQAREESEEAEAVRLVEEFEREEARKTELLRRERERQEAERRRRELEERIAREEARRAAVEIKFTKLRDALEELNALQRVAVAQELDCRAAALQHEAEAARAALGEKNAAERQRLRSSAVAKLTAREKELDEELAARIKEERRVEEQYHAQLRTHYRCSSVSSKKGKEKETKETMAGEVVAERQIEQLMKTLRRRNDEGFAAWRKWMDAEWETYQYRVLEGRDIRLESLDVAETRLEESMGQQSAAFKKERRAHLQWVDVVVEERQKMLAEMETDETDNGGEDIEEWLAEQEAIATVALEDLPPSPPRSSPISESSLSLPRSVPQPLRPAPSSPSPSDRMMVRRQGGVIPEMRPRTSRRYLVANVR